MVVVEAVVVDPPRVTFDHAEAMAPKDRGVTTIAEKVVAKIATQVISDLERIGGSRQRGLRKALSWSDETRPHVSAQLDGNLARLRVDVAVEYPAPIREVTRQVRAASIARVHELSGVEVKEVDIVVVALPRTRHRLGRVQ